MLALVSLHFYTGWARNTWWLLKWNNILRQCRKSLWALIDPYRVHENYINNLCLNIALFMWPPGHLIHICSGDGKDIVTFCSIFMGMPWIHAWICSFKSQIWQVTFCIPCFWHSRKGGDLVLQDQMIFWRNIILFSPWSCIFHCDISDFCIHDYIIMPAYGSPFKLKVRTSGKLYWHLR